MALWGYKDGNEKVPTWIENDPSKKRNCYTTPAGWVLKDDAGNEELIVAFKNLANIMGEASIVAVEVSPRNNYWSNVDITVVYNTPVVINTAAGVPYIQLSGGKFVSGFQGKAFYLSGSNTNQIIYQLVAHEPDDVFTLDSATAITANSAVITNYYDTASANLKFTSGGYELNANLTPNLTANTFIVTTPVALSTSIGTRTASANLDYTISFSRPVSINTATGIPCLNMTAVPANLSANAFIVGSNTANLIYYSGNNTTDIVFQYVPRTGDNTVSITSITGINSNGGSIALTSNLAFTCTANIRAAGYSRASDISSSLASITIVK